MSVAALKLTKADLEQMVDHLHGEHLAYWMALRRVTAAAMFYLPVSGAECDPESFASTVWGDELAAAVRDAKTALKWDDE